MSHTYIVCMLCMNATSGSTISENQTNADLACDAQAETRCKVHAKTGQVHLNNFSNGDIIVTAVTLPPSPLRGCNLNNVCASFCPTHEFTAQSFVPSLWQATFLS